MPGPLDNARHERFAQELAGGASQVEAYELSGYKPDTGAASRLSANVSIESRVAELKLAAAANTVITIERVMAELGKLGFANMADYMSVGPDGDPFLDFSALSRDQAAALTEVTVEDFKDGRGEDARDVRRVKFKLADKRAALVDLAKMLGGYSEKHEHTGKDGGPIEIADTDLARLIVFQLTKASRA